MVRRALILGGALLAACSPPLPFIAGPEQLGPMGWYDYCHRHPEDTSCAYAAAQRQQSPQQPGERAAGVVSGP